MEDGEREWLRRRTEEMDKEERDGEREKLRRRRVESRSERANAAIINDRIYLGPMCQRCQALKFPNESLDYCHNGKVSLPPIEACPTQLKDLLTGMTTDSRNFHSNIRQYNSTFFFDSFGGSKGESE